jgi:hypothetical protein
MRSLLMVRRRACAVSNHEETYGSILRDAAKTPLLRMRSNHRTERVQVSPPQSMPTQPSTLNVSGPDTEMLLA